MLSITIKLWFEECLLAVLYKPPCFSLYILKTLTGDSINHHSPWWCTMYRNTQASLNVEITVYSLKRKFASAKFSYFVKNGSKASGTCNKNSNSALVQWLIKYIKLGYELPSEKNYLHRCRRIQEYSPEHEPLYRATQWRTPTSTIQH